MMKKLTKAALLAAATAFLLAAFPACEHEDKGSSGSGGGNAGSGGGNGTGGGSTTTNYKFSLQDLVEAIGARLDTDSVEDNTQLVESDFTGDNEFLTLLEEKSSNKYRTQSSGCFEIAGDALSVTFKGTGSITISFISTSGSNTSAIALSKKDDDFMTASNAENATLLSDDALGNKRGYYAVSGTSLSGNVTYAITTPGTYIISSIYYYENNGATQSRGCRIKGISMTDTTE